MIFKLNASTGQPLYLQLIQQVRHAIETGVLRNGDVLPGIRTLAEQMKVSHNTVAKAYSELEHERLLDLRHGAGAFVVGKRSTKTESEKIRAAQERVRLLIEQLKRNGFSDEEIQRLVEAQLLYSTTAEKRRK